MNLPHTWNAVDGNDGNGSYYRGKCWYAKTFETPKQPLKSGRVFVEILAASSEATIWVNGTEITYHEGGHSCFRADVTVLCKEEGENLLVVACSNIANDFVYPQNADFTLPTVQATVITIPGSSSSSAPIATWLTALWEG